MDNKAVNKENEELINEELDTEKENETMSNNESDENNEGSNKELEEKVKQLELEKDELQNKFLRVQADFENFKRRTKKERENDLKYKSQDLATEIIPVLDNFERALQVEIKDDSMKSFVDGIKMIYHQLTQALEQVGVEEIKAENEMFDPQVHQAVLQVQEEGFESNQIVEVMQKGYKLKDRVLRAAMVKVNE